MGPRMPRETQAQQKTRGFGTIALMKTAWLGKELSPTWQDPVLGGIFSARLIHRACVSTPGHHRGGRKSPSPWRMGSTVASASRRHSIRPESPDPVSTRQAPRSWLDVEGDTGEVKGGTGSPAQLIPAHGEGAGTLVRSPPVDVDQREQLTHPAHARQHHSRVARRVMTIRATGLSHPCRRQEPDRQRTPRRDG